MKIDTRNTHQCQDAAKRIAARPMYASITLGMFTHRYNLCIFKGKKRVRCIARTFASLKDARSYAHRSLGLRTTVYVR